ncbi:MAG: diadenylate cyclase [Bacilli bacterium]|nr:diadenylate cyclase [Bacilli bacterium]
MPLLVEFLETPRQIADFVIALVLVAVIIFCAIRCKFSLFSVVLLTILGGLSITFSALAMPMAAELISIITIAVLFICSLSHIGSIRVFFDKTFKSAQVTKKTGPQKLLNRDAVYNEIYEAVSACSRQKIGALITFERHDDLEKVTKNGTVINAPVTHELLTTIFYPGTRLHDGAVIIKGNMIYAASVYYTPTTKALSGKYGSRHRAAIGISEMSDAVTVVVSEETGRISIAKRGEIEPVTLDDFVATLSEKIAEDE